ncbi:hypothetical protein D9M72_460580 [compost metagenome]
MSLVLVKKKLLWMLLTHEAVVSRTLTGRKTGPLETWTKSHPPMAPGMTASATRPCVS